MTSYVQLDKLEAAREVNPTTGNSYVFPADSTQWVVPDQLRWKYQLLDKLISIFNLPMEPFLKASLVPHVSSDVYQFLAHEALNVCSEASPSQDYTRMGALFFPRLHHLNLHGFELDLEEELDTLDKTKKTSKEQLVRVRTLLRDYAQAIRDYEHFLKYQFQPPSAKKLYPFHETLLPTMITRMDADPLRARKDNIYYGIITPYEQFGNALIGKVFGALFGGIMLIVPMIIMTIHASVAKSLITSSISVGIVATAVIFLSDGNWRDVLGITAAYTAVVVVFVGTSVSGHS